MTITVHDLKQHAVVSIDDDDQILQDCLDDALNHCELEVGRAINVGAKQKVFSCFIVPLLLEPNLQTVTQIQYVDTDGVTQTLATTEYDVVTSTTIGRVEPAYVSGSVVTWPDTRVLTEAVFVDYTAGYNTIPNSLRRAVLMLASHFYENREATISGTVLREIPLGVANTLHHYRVHHI